jgi:2-polyprenyl-3-methyl-5-hydroxy-6-metoxy-1,4-benzoquinol methylase
VSDNDRERWDNRYGGAEPATTYEIALPAVFAEYAELFPTSGRALDIACGRGLAAVWLARRGLDVLGLDVSPVAVDQADELARAAGVATRCRFSVADLDDGLPDRPSANVLLCNKFRDYRLDSALLSMLAPEGILAISALSEVGASPGPFRAKPGELRRAFGALEVITAGEDAGLAWLLARRNG